MHQKRADTCDISGLLQNFRAAGKWGAGFTRKNSEDHRQFRRSRPAVSQRGEQADDRSAETGQHKIRPEVAERLEYEAAQVQSRMRKDQAVALAHHVAGEKKIEINAARGIAGAARGTPEGNLDAAQKVEQR